MKTLDMVAGNNAAKIRSLFQLTQSRTTAELFCNVHDVTVLNQIRDTCSTMEPSRQVVNAGSRHPCLLP